MNPNSRPILPGSYVRVAERLLGAAAQYGIRPNANYQVKSCRYVDMDNGSTPMGFMVTLNLADGGVSTELGTDWFESVADDNEPTISFTDREADPAKGLPKRNRYSARLYAARAAVARKLDPEHKTTLEALASAEEVPLMAAQDAIVAAFSTLDRHKKSAQRAEAAKELRHLYYIVGNGVGNLVRGLEAVDGGKRIAELTNHVTELRGVVERKSRDIETERRKVDQLQAETLAVVERAALLERERNAERQSRIAMEAKLDLREDSWKAQQRAYEATIKYALTLLPEADQHRVAGYTRGLCDAIEGKA